MRLMKRIKGWLIAETPIELIACEYGCRDTECDQERWASCPNRLRRAEEERAARARAEADDGGD